MTLFRTVSLLLVLCSTGLVIAQPDVNRDDVFRAGDTFQWLAVNPGNADPGPAGTGITWDFSGLPRTPDGDFENTYDDVSIAPNAGQFPEANLVNVQDAGPIDAYTFYNVNDQRVVLEGLDLPEVGVVTYSDKQIFMEFPFSYNETQTDEWVGTYTFNIDGFSGTANRTGNHTTTYDGFGTIILPDGTTVNNVRRFVSDLLVIDEVDAGGVTLTTRVETTTYAWWADGERAPVFQLTFGETTVDPPGQVVSSAGASYRGVDPGEEPPIAASGNRLPHLTVQGGNFNTDVLIQNVGNSDASITLQPFGIGGNSLIASEVAVPAGQTIRDDQSTFFADPTAASFAPEGCDSCLVTVGYRAAVEGGSTAHVHQTDRLDTEFYFYPGEWDLLFDGAAIVNAGDAAAKIEAIQIGNNGQELGKITLVDSLPPDGKFLDVFNGKFDDNPNSIIKLESDQPMAVMVLRISTDGRFLYENQPLPDDIEGARWIAHITSADGGFDTDVYIHNDSGDPQSVTFQPYSADGSAMDAVNVDVAGHATARFAKTDLFDNATSHASISGSNQCTVTVGYRARVTDASTAPIHEAPPVGTRFVIYPGEWDVLFDGMALVNTGNADAVVTATTVGDNGQTLGAAVLAPSLPPNAKFLGVLEGQLDNVPDSHIVIESTQPLAILSLRLSKDGRYLYGNAPIPE